MDGQVTCVGLDLRRIGVRWRWRVDQKRRVKIPIPTYQCRRSDDDFAVSWNVNCCNANVNKQSFNQDCTEGKYEVWYEHHCVHTNYHIMMSTPRISPGRLDTIHPTQDSTSIKKSAQNVDQSPSSVNRTTRIIDLLESCPIHRRKCEFVIMSIVCPARCLGVLLILEVDNTN